MAAIVFTESARQLAQQLIEDMPEFDGPSVSIVAVVWSNGARDNRRGRDGKAIWEVTEAPGWKSVVAPWAETEEVPLAQNTFLLHGLTVFADPKAKSAAGTLVVDAAQGKLFVEHQAA